MSLTSRLPYFLSNSQAWTNQRRWLGRKIPKPGKAPILPPGRTKLYQIYPAKWMKPEYVADLLWRRHTYNNAILSMRRLFREEYEQQQEACIGLDRLKKEVHEELGKLLAENEQRNRDLAIAREEREKETQEKLEQEILQNIERRLDRETQNVQRKAVEVEEMIKQSENFITMENLEEKINDALENPVNYDFAIDLNYTKIPNPPPVKCFEGIRTRQTSRSFDYAPGFAFKEFGQMRRIKQGRKPFEKGRISVKETHKENEEE